MLHVQRTSPAYAFVPCRATHLRASHVAYGQARNAIAHLPPVGAAVQQYLAPLVVLGLVLTLELDGVVRPILNLKLEARAGGAQQLILRMEDGDEELAPLAILGQTLASRAHLEA